MEIVLIFLTGMVYNVFIVYLFSSQFFIKNILKNTEKN